MHMPRDLLKIIKKGKMTYITKLKHKVGDLKKRKKQ